VGIQGGRALLCLCFSSSSHTRLPLLLLDVGLSLALLVPHGVLLHQRAAGAACGGQCALLIPHILLLHLLADSGRSKERALPRHCQRRLLLLLLLLLLLRRNTHQRLARKGLAVAQPEVLLKYLERGSSTGIIFGHQLRVARPRTLL
jgi:hypothetical protein